HEFQADHPAEYAAFRRSDWDAVSGAERQAAVIERMTSALADLASQLAEDGVGVAVSHGAAIRTVVTAMLGWPPEHGLAMRAPENCGYAVMRRSAPDAPWRLAAYNRVAAEAGPI